jgi:hypothetical protein
MHTPSPLPEISAQPMMLDMDELTDVTKRLTDLLNTEVVLLEQMQVTKASELQPEKETLTKLLEAQKRMLVNNPDTARAASAESRETLTEAFGDLQTALHRNIRMVAIAREVNARVVKAISDTLTEQFSTGAYTKTGETSGGKPDAISITINQQI